MMEMQFLHSPSRIDKLQQITTLGYPFIKFFNEAAMLPNYTSWKMRHTAT